MSTPATTRRSASRGRQRQQDRRLQRVNARLVTALRECVASGALPRPVEKRASSALREAMQGKARLDMLNRAAS